MLICKNCGKERSKGRRICRECYLEAKRKGSRERYHKFKKRTLYTHKCEACAIKFMTSRKTSAGLCKDCRKLLRKKELATNNYENA